MIPSGIVPTAHFMAATTPACARDTSAQAYWLLGYPEKGLAIGTESLALADAIRDPFSLELALFFNVMLCLDCGEPELALQRLEIAEKLVSEQRLGFVWEPRFLRGAALSAQGAIDEAVLKKKLGLTRASAKEERGRVYRIGEPS